MALDNQPQRIVSMDQFRGYTVAGMLFVNYIGGMSAFHDVLKHHSVYFSYADSIMPSFFFAVGYSFRLTVLRRIPQMGFLRTYWTYFRRSLSLILISLMFFGFNANKDVYGDWENYSWQTGWNLITTIIKSDLWETLALIGVTQVFLLPFIHKSLKFRSFLIVGFLFLHAILSYLFNFNFAHQQPNALEDLLIKYLHWGAAGSRCWESGPFGVLGWSVAMLSGSIAYDIVSGNTPIKSVGKLFALGVLFMSLGYSISCLTRLYDVDKGEGAPVAAAEASNPETVATETAAPETSTPETAATESAAPDAETSKSEDEEKKSDKDAEVLVSTPWAGSPKDLEKFAVSPVWPPLDRALGHGLTSMLAEPPFVPPPEQSKRRINYWMMTKQLPSPSFILFASGFAFTLYSLFVLACDIGPIRIGLFRTFGQNPLAAYLLHNVVEHSLHTISPENAPLYYCLISTAVFFLIVYALVRGLEKQGIYIRL